MGFWSNFWDKLSGKKEASSEEPAQESSAVNEQEDVKTEENSAEVSQEGDDSYQTENEQQD